MSIFFSKPCRGQQLTQALSVLLAIIILAAFSQGCGIIKPEPISPAEHLKRVEEDRLALYVGQEPLTEPLSMEMAIARALKYNFDHRLALMEVIFQDDQLTMSTLALLPKLAANSSYSNRDNEAASSSISYSTRKETLEPSVSSEMEKVTGDLTLTWNILDFGLSYYQAKQQADRFLILQERRRRIANNIVKEVIAAYWKALAAERLLPKVNRSIREAEGALKSHALIAKEDLASPVESLEQQRDLLAIINQLSRLRDDMTVSRIKLASLINVPLDHRFKLAKPDKFFLTPPPLNFSLAQYENRGLAARADLREEAYQERIDAAEVKKEIIRMFPGVSLFAGFNYDSNRYMVNQHWNEVGARVSFNLLGLISGPVQYKAAKTKVDVTYTRRLAQTMAALVQINLSYHQYRQALEDYSYAQKADKLEKKIYQIALSELEADAQSKLDNVRRSVNALRSQMELDRTLSDLYLYWGNMYFSLGGDIVPVQYDNIGLPDLTSLVLERLKIWWRGELPFEDLDLSQTASTSQATVPEDHKKAEIK